FPNSPVGPVDQYNQDIEEFNALTQAGGGAPCYLNTNVAPVVGTPDPACGATSIRNPYYGMAPQSLVDPHGWYEPGLDFPFISPNTFSLILNYKHGKFAITPAMSLAEGTTYGSAADVEGLDPRNCSANQGSVGVTTGNPLNADYTSCGFALTNNGSVPGSLYIPNPQTGTFDSFGEFRQPWQFNLGLTASYDVSPRATARVIVTNLVNKCFGGTPEPWTAANPPNNVICGYTSNTFYNGGNYFNGASFNDVAANGVPENPYFAQSFVPSFGDPFSSNYPLALNVYASIQFKL
ncbi:MAG: hypothetical protein JOZ38_11595, partial [Candidatus Eremiobacteraeota bacterium]|nr:hypothetical protein [Candidatus Eremiobacteraeota bacterium]